MSSRLSMLVCLSLAACGGGGAVPAPQAGTNGLAFAAGGEKPDDLIGVAMPVTVIRAVTDHGSGATRLVASAERLTLDEIGTNLGIRLTLGTETLTFVNAEARDSGGKLWSTYLNTSGDASSTLGVFHYDYEGGAGDFDTEGFLVFGFETDPRWLSRETGSVRYRGDWFGYGTVVDAAGAVVAAEAGGGGTLTLDADLDAMRIGGEIAGSFTTFGDVSGRVSSATIDGNGFAAAVTLDCPPAGTCGSETALSGRFFGAEGGEISGLIAWDERRARDGESAIRLISGSSYTLERVTD